MRLRGSSASLRPERVVVCRAFFVAVARATLELEAELGGEHRREGLVAPSELCAPRPRRCGTRARVALLVRSPGNEVAAHLE